MDPNIRTWVFIPVVAITFLLGLFKHYLSIFLEKDVTGTLQQYQDRQFLIRCHVLRINAAYIPKSSFLNRRYFFTVENCTLRKTKVQTVTIFEPNTYFNIFKNNLINVLPMFLIGGWIMYMFSGFIATRLPFALTIRFKAMLQREIVLRDLSASWVSSASWYFINVCGLRNIFSMVLGDKNAADSDGKENEEDYIEGVPKNISETAIINEIEELHIVEHDWILNELKT